MKKSEEKQNSVTSRTSRQHTDRGITFYYEINVTDYTNSDPVDLFPIIGLCADGPPINVDLDDIKAGVEFELHGLHLQSEHPNPGF